MPNGDGRNETFRIAFLPTGSSLTIYNRPWGRVSYRAALYRNDWRADGHPEGVYVYRLVLPDAQVFTGTVTVIR